MSETKRQSGDAESEFDPFDGFNVARELPVQKFVDFGFDAFGEYIHIVPDVERRQIRLYRSISETGEDNERISTVIDNVSFTFHHEDREQPEVNAFYLTSSEADTFLTTCDLIAEGREGTLTVEWWEESGRPMMQGEKTGEELLMFKWTKPNGVERRNTVSSVWQTPTHKMANIEGEGF